MDAKLKKCGVDLICCPIFHKLKIKTIILLSSQTSFGMLTHVSKFDSFVRSTNPSVPDMYANGCQSPQESCDLPDDCFDFQGGANVKHQENSSTYCLDFTSPLKS